MRKIVSFLFLVVLFSFLAVPISCTRSYETQIIFVPETSETSLRSAASKGNMDELDTSEESYRKAIEKVRQPDLTAAKAIWSKTVKDMDEMKTGIKKTQEQYDTEMNNARIASITAKIDACVFDLNKLSRDGWEIKASRRVWNDFNDNGKPDSYEWGTEYTLQKKKGWW